MYYYPQQYPKKGVPVIVRIKEIMEHGVYVTLEEYNGLEGFISCNEISHRRGSSFSRTLRVGKYDIAVVQDVDEDKGYVDLSKKGISLEEKEALKKEWRKTKTVYTICYEWSLARKEPVEDVYARLIYPLYAAGRQHPYDVFKEWTHEEGVDPLLREIICRKIQKNTVKYMTLFDVICYTSHGIDGIQASIRHGLQTSPQLTIHYNIPSFSLSVIEEEDEGAGLETLQRACAAIDEKIKEFGGAMRVHQPPQLVGSTEDNDAESDQESEEGDL